MKIPEDYLNEKIESANTQNLTFFIPVLMSLGLILIILDYFLYHNLNDPYAYIIHWAHWALFLPHFIMFFYIKKQKSFFPVLSFSSVILSIFLTLVYDLINFQVITVYVYGILGGFFILYFKPIKSLLISIITFTIFIFLLVSLRDFSSPLLFRSNLINGILTAIVAYLFSFTKYTLIKRYIEKEFLLENANKEILIKSKEIEKSYKQLKELQDRENRMFAAIAHELNTPLSVIYGHLNMLKKDCIKDSKKERQFNAIERNVKRLIKNVDKILEMIKTQLPIEKEQFEYIKIKEFFEPIIYDFEVLSKEKEIIFKYDIEDAKIYMNKSDLLIIVDNLLDNAFKYTDKNNQVYFYTKIENDKIRIGIKDSGIGIKEEEKDKILKEFYRSKISNKKSVSGLGLGLNIVQTILTKYNSILHIESEENKGSEFYFYLKINNGKNS